MQRYSFSAAIARIVPIICSESKTRKTGVTNHMATTSPMSNTSQGKEIKKSRLSHIVYFLCCRYVNISLIPHGLQNSPCVEKGLGEV